MNDAALVDTFRRGDSNAFAVLIMRHRPLAYAVARAIVRNPVAAEDVAQEATFQAYFEIGRLQHPERFGPWLCGIAANLAKMTLRAGSRTESLDEILGGRYQSGLHPDERSDPQLVAEAQELRDSIERALESLPSEMRMAVWLHYAEGLPYREVSAITGIPAGRLRVLSHRARRRLQAEMASEWRPRQRRRMKKMIPVTVDDVRMQFAGEPSGPGPESSRGPQWVVILKSEEDERTLSIWVGPAEGYAIATHLAGIAPPRPQTYAFMSKIIDAVGARLEQVAIRDLTEDTFIASVTLVVGGQRVELDARPSDGLNLALRGGSPIFVGDSVMERAGFLPGADVLKSLEERAKDLYPRFFGGAAPERIEFRSGTAYAQDRWREQQEDLQRARLGREGQR